MNGRDAQGRFTRRNEYASMGGRARAERLTAERRSAIARAGFRGLVDTRFDGDRGACLDWLGKVGAFAYDRPYRERGWGVMPNPGPCPARVNRHTKETDR